MNEQEIKERILVCEKCEKSYIQAGDMQSANRFSNEIKKWKDIIDRLNHKPCDNTDESIEKRLEMNKE